jgi:hypothetical protein
VEAPAGQIQDSERMANGEAASILKFQFQSHCTKPIVEYGHHAGDVKPKSLQTVSTNRNKQAAAYGKAKAVDFNYRQSVSIIRKYVHGATARVSRVTFHSKRYHFSFGDEIREAKNQARSASKPDNMIVFFYDLRSDEKPLRSCMETFSFRAKSSF